VVYKSADEKAPSRQFVVFYDAGRRVFYVLVTFSEPGQKIESRYYGPFQGGPFQKLGLPAPPGQPEAREKAKEAASGPSRSGLYRVEPFDLLTIRAIGTLPDFPIDHTYFVGPGGFVALGPAYGSVRLEGATLEEAERRIRIHLLQCLRDPKVQVTWAGHVRKWHSVTVLQASDRITPPTFIRLQVTGTLTDHPIDGKFLVDPSGRIALGAPYGNLNVKGLTVEQAKDAIGKHLKRFLKEPTVTASLVSERAIISHDVLPTSLHRITTADLLRIDVMGTLADRPIRGIYLLERSGEVALGPAYGRVRVEGLTVEEAETAIQQHLRKVLNDPVVSVTLAGWESDNEQTAEQRLRSLEEQVSKLRRTVQELDSRPGNRN
jgi:protein involved in polysaccharide export with SLBB domain